MRRVVCVLLLLALIAPASAVAQSSVAPPGNAGVDEYQESVPTASGNKPTTGKDGAVTNDGSGGGASDPLTRSAEKALDAQGADGQAAAQVARQTAPSGAGVAAGNGTGGAAVQITREHEAPSAIGSLASAIGGSGGDGMGAALPVLLLVTALGGVAWVLVRRRAV